MTGPDPALPLPRNRAHDQGRRGSIRQWWHDWGQLLTGVCLIAMAATLVILGFQISGLRTNTDQAARVSCERSRAFGPYLARDYKARGVLPPNVLELYTTTIPVKCPR